MTNPDYTAVMLVVDRSGSMNHIRTSAEDAINEFIHSQRTPEGRRTIRIAQFDDAYETVCVSTDAARVPSFELVPRGMTALLDAIGFSLTDFGAELAAMPEAERPGTVVFAIMTDGAENSSIEHNWPGIKERLQRQQNEFGWKILYLGANQDAVIIGDRLGVPRGRTMTYAATDHGTRSVVNTMTSYVAAAASGHAVDFTDAQREDATK